MPRDMRRSRSPFDRDRRDRNREPLRRSPPPSLRGGSYRPRSRTPDRRDDRYAPSSYRRASPPRESGRNSAMTSRSASGVSSPRPVSQRGRDDRSRPQSPFSRSPAPISSVNAVPIRTTTPRPPSEAQPTPTRSPTRPRSPPRARSPQRARSPPRGPAALRPPPTGPSTGRSFASPASSSSTPARHPSTPSVPQTRTDIASPSVPPSGPRGYNPPPRGGAYTGRGGRGGWGGAPQRHLSGPSPSPVSTPAGPPAIPTGPRATTSPSLVSKPFNPPAGPSAQHTGGPTPRPTLTQSLMNTMPAIVPGGKPDPSLAPLATGVTRELEQHHRRLREEEERVREEARAKEERLRKSLRVWDRLERESKAFELKSDLSEKSLKNIAGEGMGGAAF